MHPVTQSLVILAALAILVGAAVYVKANTSSGCFLGYCGTVIKTPG